MKSIAEYYGWVSEPCGTFIVSECVECGAEINDHRGAVIYECERCMNSHEE
ncbi:hypothetical protein DNHGIG_35420 [Collibacillus ludicampi]|uniref:YhfH family protein n=1 Tax=Collibacillus ludicampi TaxID=2771369 RepID=A0AAV4LJK0_9BACL|nr:hypothetical protein [Collibacillus ludicampi]GIM47993.1 hypothetical protein DNHGIG_35420 [Collibacillus ludicampi]